MIVIFCVFLFNFTVRSSKNILFIKKLIHINPRFIRFKKYELFFIPNDLKGDFWKKITKSDLLFFCIIVLKFRIWTNLDVNITSLIIVHSVYWLKIYPTLSNGKRNSWSMYFRYIIDIEHALATRLYVKNSTSTKQQAHKFILSILLG